MNYIQCINLDKKIKNKNILSNINFSVNKGDIVGLYGPNGSGKSILLKIICGLTPSSSGKIIVDNKIIGKDISHPKNIGIFIETPSFVNEFTVFKNLKFLALINNKIDDSRINEIISYLNLDKYTNEKYKNLSLGTKQRLGLAQALMEDPSLLLLDEPTNALDENAVSLIENILKKEKEKGTTIIVTSHDKSFLEGICDSILFINEGEIS